MDITEQAEKISKRASELVKEGIPTVMAIDIAYKEVMKGEKENETK